jgi:site-specific recombinase XerC
MEWVVKLEARSGWGEVETIEVATIKRRVVGLTGFAWMIVNRWLSSTNPAQRVRSPKTKGTIDHNLRLDASGSW